jgi:hypothetical protein
VIDERFVYLAFLFNISATASYLFAVIKGTAKPHKVTWFLWALAPLIAFSAQISQGVGISSLMTFAVGFGPLLIFLASFLNKKSDWKITKFDLFCGSISIFAIILWMLTSDAFIALIFSMAADLIACIPTLIKSYYYPVTEDVRAYVFAAISAVITLASLQIWTFDYYGFPLQTFIICAIFVILLKFKLGKIFLYKKSPA